MSIFRYCLVVLLLTSSGAALADSLWDDLREGRAMMILRHASAPGIGDPAGFELDNCATQRNLNDLGREEARRWGDALRAQGLGAATVYASRWCRAQETAEGFRLGRVQPQAELDSFFQSRGTAQSHGLALRAFIAGLPKGEPIIMVSHQVNITELTGEFPASGEAFVLALPLATPVKLLARIRVPDE
tara:strand:- start:45753 stop:46316 length:564 start_codon:yes stop_codon:yes gene_type:complete